MTRIAIYIEGDAILSGLYWEVRRRGDRRSPA